MLFKDLIVRHLPDHENMNILLLYRFLRIIKKQMKKQLNLLTKLVKNF
jgi:hypothetical protein